jgi:hypothetical protein
MAFRNGNYATIWGVSEDDRDRVIVEMSTSRKDKKTDEYVTDFSSKFVQFFGDAGKRALKLERKDRIKLLDVSVTNSYNKETQKGYTNFTVFDWEPADGSGSGVSKKKPQVDEPYDGEIDEDDLPV